MVAYWENDSVNAIERWLIGSLMSLCDADSVHPEIHRNKENMSFKSLIRESISRFIGLDVRRMKSPTQTYWDALLLLHGDSAKSDDIESEFQAFCRTNFLRSKGQLFQDLFVLHETQEMRAGYFVEFGATNGIDLSNTYLLETEYGWHGILAEPARVWSDALANNRTSMIDYRCVTDHTGDTVRFNETEVGELSTIDSLSSRDMHSASRRSGTRYDVTTVSLNDMLEAYDAPKEFDYLSIDTEGSEYNILSALDFDRFRPRIITVEHNFVQETRDKLHTLLIGQGYRRKFETLSQFDDWYVAL